MANYEKRQLAGGLYLVATPIGTARDITLRTLDILASADVIAAEDTRSMRHLMDIHGVPLEGRPLLAYHDHNGARMRPRLMAALAEGKSVAYGSEAGTPLVADPGYQLGVEAISEGFNVVSAPGPSAVLAALTVAGLPTDRFLFAGFLPNAGAARRGALEELAGVPATLVFYESPKRVAAMLRDAAAVLGGERRAALCRELTKKFEEVLRGTLDELVAELETRSVKGEVVVLIDRGHSESLSEDDIDIALRQALATMSMRDAAEAVAAAYGLPKRQVYQMALKMKDSS